VIAEVVEREVERDLVGKIRLADFGCSEEGMKVEIDTLHTEENNHLQSTEVLGIAEDGFRRDENILDSGCKSYRKSKPGYEIPHQRPC
jgi:hypothetical protein